MRISEYVIWVLLSFGAIFVSTVFFPDSWPSRAKIMFRFGVGFLFFVMIGVYWVATGEKPDETFYRHVLCPVRFLHSFERCSQLASGTAASNPAVLPPISGNAPTTNVRGTAELQRLTKEALDREAEMRRLLEQQAERQEKEYEARQRDMQAQSERQKQQEREQEAQRQREIERQNFLRTHKFGATAVGRNGQSGGLRAVTIVDATSSDVASSQAEQRCNELATDCKVVAHFSGPSKCVYVAGGTTNEPQFGRVMHHVGADAAFSEDEALAKCRSRFASCRIFHVRCNSGVY